MMERDFQVYFIKIIAGAFLVLSVIACSGGSQLPFHEETQETMERFMWRETEASYQRPAKNQGLLSEAMWLSLDTDPTALI